MLMVVKLLSNVSNNSLRLKCYHRLTKFGSTFKGVVQIQWYFSRGIKCNFTRFTKPREFYSNNLSCKRYFSSNSYFSLSDYDCVGFDLDNTICEYNLNNLVNHEFNVIVEHLVENFGHNRDVLLKPLQPRDIDFLQKGLIIDTERGNLLKIRRDGFILKACHGSKFLNDEEIANCYGRGRNWYVATQFGQNPVIGWIGPLGHKLRTLADYFDMPAALALSRCIDSKLTDTNDPGSLDYFNIWSDLLNTLLHVYRREHFSLNLGVFKNNIIKSNPDAYYKKCSDVVVGWLKELKRSKVTFLITGSNGDHASHTASLCLGDNWRDYFHSVVCYARKPGFFLGGRPFMKLDGFTEVGTISNDEIRLGEMYSQGNWQGLRELFVHATGKVNPRCLYVGDNLIQDIFTVSEYTCCDTVAIAEELNAEFTLHTHKDILLSEAWGPYFNANNGTSTIWDCIIRNYSKICIPNLDVLASKDFNYKFSTFSGTHLGYHLKTGPLDFNIPS